MVGVINMLGKKTKLTSFGRIELSALTLLDCFPRLFLGDQMMSVHSLCAIPLSQRENGEG